jgi:predicted porin
MFNHYVGVFAGYRSSQLEDKEAHVKETVYGPLFGVRGTVPLSQQFSLFGRLTYLLTKVKEEHGGTSETEKAPGYIAEFGGKYNFTDALALVLGYKMETTKTDIHKIKDTFSGVTLDVTYAF